MKSLIEVSFGLVVPEIAAQEIAAVLEHVLTAEKAEFDLSVAIVDDLKIHEINRNYLNHDYPTDVIAFDLGTEGPGAAGEVIVSAETARREAADRGVEMRSELLLYCVHGALHLLGYDDHEDQDRRRMHARQRELLAELGYETTE